MKELLNTYVELMTMIAKIISYDDPIAMPIEIELDTRWSLEKEDLRLYEENTLHDYWPFTISLNHERKSFYGEKDGYFIAMAYPEDRTFRDASILILKKENRIH